MHNFYYRMRLFDPSCNTDQGVQLECELQEILYQNPRNIAKANFCKTSLFIHIRLHYRPTKHTCSFLMKSDTYFNFMITFIKE